MPASAVSGPTWATIMTAAGAAIGALVAIFGAVFAARYGRRANVSVSASVVRTSAGLVVVARPVVQAVGVLRVKLRKGAEGSRLLVAEVRSDGKKLLPPVIVAGEEGFLAGAIVEGGESVMTSTLLAIPEPDPAAVGWAVWFDIFARNRFLRVGWLRRVPGLRKFLRWVLPDDAWAYLKRLVGGWTWFDQVFLRTPTTKPVSFSQEVQGAEEKQASGPTAA